MSNRQLSWFSDSSSTDCQLAQTDITALNKSRHLIARLLERCRRKSSIDNRPTHTEMPIPIPLSLSKRSPNIAAVVSRLSSSTSSLPCGVRDVDVDYFVSDPLHTWDLAQDMVRYMMSLEQKVCDFFVHMPSLVAPKIRAILIDWLIQVQHHLRLLPSTLYLAVSIVDRYCHLVTVKPTKLQLVGVAALFIASKIEERFPCEIGQLVYLTDNTYTRNEVLKMEVIIVRELQFWLTSPEPNFFLERYAVVATVVQEKEVIDMARYMIDLVLIEPMYYGTKPSVVAAAALCLAGKFSEKLVWDETLQYFTTYTENELISTMSIMCKILRLAGHGGQYTGAYRKYSSKSYRCLARSALLDARYNAVIAELADLVDVRVEMMPTQAPEQLSATVLL